MFLRVFRREAPGIFFLRVFRREAPENFTCFSARSAGIFFYVFFGAKHRKFHNLTCLTEIPGWGGGPLGRKLAQSGLLDTIWWLSGSPMGAQWGANGSQSDPQKEPEVSLGRPMDPAEPHTGRFWLEQGKQRKTSYFIGSERLGGGQTGAKWRPFGAPVELLWPTGSLLGARRGVWEAFASPEGRFRALFEPQWLRRGVLRAPVAPIFRARPARGRRIAERC